MIIDAHVHLMGFPSLVSAGDKLRTMEAVVGFRTRYPEIYAATLTEAPIDNTDDLIAAMDQHGIAHAVVQARPGPVPNDLVAEAVRRHPKRLTGVLRIGHDQVPTGYPLDPSRNRLRAIDEIARGVEELGLKGVGETFVRAFTRAIHPERIADDLDGIMRAVARYRVPIQFPTAWSQFPGGLLYGDPLWVDEVAARYPQVPIILTKMGRGLTYYFEMAMAVALRNANVFFDMVDSTPAHLTQAVKALGADRIMFGTDWSATWRWLQEPADLYTLRKHVVEQAQISDTDREWIYWRTAAQLYGLDHGVGQEGATWPS